MTTEQDLELVTRYQKEIFLLSQTSSLLGWDQQTYMPGKAAQTRAEQISFLSSLIHEKMISNEFFEAVNRLYENKDKLNEDNQAIIRKLYKEIAKSRKLPKEFVEELSKTTSLAHNVWKEAKQKSDFNIFKPYLKKIIDLKRKQTDYIHLSGHPYNSLIDDFEEGMTVEKLQPFFEDLKNKIIDLLEKIESTEIYKSQQKENQKKFPINLQLEFANELAKSLGLSNENFRLDLSEHPFTTSIGLNDVRITTNVNHGFLKNFSSVMHEAGHAIHSIQLPEEYHYTILWDSPSYGISESQSRFWENLIGKGRPFWHYYFPKMDEKFKLNGDFEKWYNTANFVFPGKIRIEADEIHYCMHIILRFELEKGLIEGSIKVEDLPQIWSKKMKNYFGIVPENDSEGVLQDVHWSEGYFGYFPSYAIGSVYAVQLYAQLEKEIPNIEGDIFEGNFERIRNWLNEKVHKHGAKILADDLIKQICGEGLNPNVFIEYLKEKYSKIYQF